MTEEERSIPCQIRGGAGAFSLIGDADPDVVVSLYDVFAT